LTESENHLEVQIKGVHLDFRVVQVLSQLITGDTWLFLLHKLCNFKGSIGQDANGSEEGQNGTHEGLVLHLLIESEGDWKSKYIKVGEEVLAGEGCPGLNHFKCSCLL